MANNGTYSLDRPVVLGEQTEYSTDPAFGGFLSSDYKKHDDLKHMLDSNKDSLKLEAMKRIIGMVAKGRDASDLFPSVVKNVVSKSIEVKKLVYVYLVRYAEEQQDLALLSISTFQRALKDPNQLIRASALRVLSSIRVTMIVPIVMLAIKDSASDMSPYVRKTAAHAIPKLYRLDPEQKDELILVIEKLLSDKTTLVVGSAVMAFEEVCPERIDLIHKNYRKLCNLLVDVDEWGHVVIINMLTRYARSQFTDPNIDDFGEELENRPFYEDEEEISDTDIKSKKTYSLDSDHRLLLRNTKPLLQSRNASVVMGVAQLYHHLAPRSEVNVVAKALIRLLRSHREVQSVVLNCIASISIMRKGMFEPYLKSFFVRSSDPTHIKLLKLEILTNLATETSITVILREFQTYISSQDKEFVAAAIQAIGRCASNIEEVTDTCLNGLVSLLSNRDEAVVAESVVVIKKLLQTQSSEHNEIIIHMAKLVDYINVAQARASILWLLGEYSERVPKIAPDVLRKMAKNFINEDDIVKLQIINLAVKLSLTNPKQTKLLCQYVFSLARYDQNYDLRDRARFLRHFFLTTTNGNDSKLSKHAKKIFLATKPAPVLVSKYKDLDHFQLGSLSHYINAPATGYHPLPEFRTEAPDSSVREVETTQITEKIYTKKIYQTSKKRSFYSESEDDEEEEDDDDDDDDEDDDNDDDGNSEEDSRSESETQSESEESSSEEDDDEEEDDTISVSSDETARHKKKSRSEQIKKITLISTKSNSDDNLSSDNEDDSGDTSSEEKVVKIKEKKTNTSQKDSKSNLDLLLELDEVSSSISSIMTPTLGGFLTPVTNKYAFIPNTFQTVPAIYTPMKMMELVNKMSAGGLSISYRYTRSPHLFSNSFVSIELTFTNHGKEELKDIQITNKNFPLGMSMYDFAPINLLSQGQTLTDNIGIDFNDSSQPAIFTINIGNIERNLPVQIKPPIGELIRSILMPESLFSTEIGKLKGMNEHSTIIAVPEFLHDAKSLSQKIFEIVNVAAINSKDPSELKFAGQTLTSQTFVFITLKLLEESKISIVVNCEKIVIGSILLNDIKGYFKH